MAWLVALLCWSSEARYYVYHGAPSAWRQAQDACVSRDSALAVPRTPGQLRALADLLARHDAAYIHSGFHCLFQHGDYASVYGEPLNETGQLEWEAGAPLAGPTYNCGAVSRRGQLAVLECERRLPFVCENQPWSEYEYFPGAGYYKLYTGGLSWVEARRRCTEDGAHLAVLGSEHEAAVLRQLLARFPTLNNTDHHDRALLGFHALFATASSCPRIHTVLGQSLGHTGYTKWKRGQPAVGSSWHCGAVTRDAELIMVSCSLKYAFVCEHEL